MRHGLRQGRFHSVPSASMYLFQIPISEFRGELLGPLDRCLVVQSPITDRHMIMRVELNGYLLRRHPPNNISIILSHEGSFSHAPLLRNRERNM